jgi:hypothetical protein
MAQPEDAGSKRSISPAETAAPNVTLAREGASDPTELLAKAFRDINDYMTSEMNQQVEEWAFIDRCNAVLSGKYEELNGKAQSSIDAIQRCQEEVDKLPVYFSRVEELERNIDVLEEVMKGLGAYTAALTQMFCAASPQ